MEPILASGIRDMYGPAFLLLYAAVIVGTLVLAYWYRRQSDRTLDLAPLVIPPQPDPLEIAYLRGGANEATRFVVFDLLQRGYLQLAPKDRIAQSPTPPAARRLAPAEEAVYAWFSRPRTATEGFGRSDLPGRVRDLCRHYDEHFRREGLLSPPETNSAAKWACVTGVLIIAGLGIYKLVAALEKGKHNVVFLVFMLIIALILLVVVCRPPRLSRRGRAYVEALQGDLGRLKKRVSYAAPAADDAAWPLLVGAFGIGALAGTEYAPLGDYFRKSQASGGWGGGCGGWISGCGSGCGGSCGGGGGCGGGCGGCGGS